MILRNRIFLITNISMLIAIIVVNGLIFRSLYRVVDSFLGLILCDCVLIFWSGESRDNKAVRKRSRNRIVTKRCQRVKRSTTEVQEK